MDAPTPTNARTLEPSVGLQPRVLRRRQRVSICLSAGEAAFLHELIRDTGNGGPLWDGDMVQSEDPIWMNTPDEPNPYTREERGALRRLYAMLARACDLHGVEAP